MILKIMREDDFQEYWKFDNIRTLTCSRVFFRGGATDLDSDIYLLDHVPDCKCMLDSNCPNEQSKCPACEAYMVLGFDRGNTTVAFDTTAYIMNNEGKTLDKIVVRF